ncbi:MAG: hypothetical protein Q7S87_01390 [Agitococcus sp.]|nr:hypothetical protein [Agitococcus sp.]MDO9177124.1 hypothetical protein [Agitococcus sp.]
MLTETEINALKRRVRAGDVWWNDGDGRCKKVDMVLLNWIEFADNPSLTEPAAILTDGLAVALNNVQLSSFVTLTPACPFN